MWYGAKRDAVRGPGWVLMCRGIDEAVCEALVLYMKNVLGFDLSSPGNHGCGSCGWDESVSFLGVCWRRLTFALAFSVGL